MSDSGNLMEPVFVLQTALIAFLATTTDSQFLPLNLNPLEPFLRQPPFAKAYFTKPVDPLTVRVAPFLVGSSIAEVETGNLPAELN